jgi:hypothetical protein
VVWRHDAVAEFVGVDVGGGVVGAAEGVVVVVVDGGYTDGYFEDSGYVVDSVGRVRYCCSASDLLVVGVAVAFFVHSDVVYYPWGVAVGRPAVGTVGEVAVR